MEFMGFRFHFLEFRSFLFLDKKSFSLFFGIFLIFKHQNMWFHICLDSHFHLTPFFKISKSGLFNLTISKKTLDFLTVILWIKRCVCRNWLEDQFSGYQSNISYYLFFFCFNFLFFLSFLHFHYILHNLYNFLNFENLCNLRLFFLVHHLFLWL
jgi:hypothetical protein